MDSLSFLSPNPYNDTLSSSSDCGSDFMYDTTPISNNDVHKTATTQRKSSKKSVNTFIEKLYSMLDNNAHSDLISWTPSGTSFAVRNAKVFAAQVLPTHFKHNNFSSFVRLLNMYGFHKISKSPRGQRLGDNEVLEFSHSHFIRGRPDLLKEVKRKTMDSADGLRRGSGDLRASLEMLQLSQTELTHQFHVLQETYTQVLHGLEESRKIQMYQEIQIRQLCEQQQSPDNATQSSSSQQQEQKRANLSHHRRSLSTPSIAVNQAQESEDRPFQMVVTTPGSSSSTQMASTRSSSSEWTNQSTAPFSYPQDNNNNNGMKLPHTQQQWDEFFSPLSFQAAANTPLPPSPMILADLPMESPRGSSEDTFGSYPFSSTLPNTLDPALF